MGYVFKGTWEELVSDPMRFAGEVVTVDVVSESIEAPEAWDTRWARAMATVESLRGRFHSISDEALTTDMLYD